MNIPQTIFENYKKLVTINNEALKIIEPTLLIENCEPFFELTNKFHNNEPIISFEILAKVLYEQFGIKTVKFNFADADKNKINAIIDEASFYLVREKLSELNNINNLPATNYVCFNQTFQNVLHIACYNPFNLDATIFNKFNIETYLCKKSDVVKLQQFIKQNNIDQSLKNNKLQNKLVENELNEIIMLVENILIKALKLEASDIHIEPNEINTRVRFRLDGQLIVFKELDNQFINQIISRLKILGGMDISEKRISQDGHFKFEYEKDNGDKNFVDIRLSTMPTEYGEKLAARIIYRKPTILKKEVLGFLQSDIKMIDNLLKSPHGAIFITGPTGSGKTTTLFTLLNELNKDNVNIVTIENPVEYTISGVNQLNIFAKTGLTFANALRAILRQDPDIIMVGEIRDEETASVAVRAAMTGHLVFSTIHTSDSISAIFRLIDMGVPDYIVLGATRAIISQRLVRRLCEFCKNKTIINEETKKILLADEEIEIVYEPKGCVKCNNTGYAGRFAIYELLVLNSKLNELFYSRKTNEEILGYLSQTGFVTMKENAMTHLKNGSTSVEEVLKILIS